MSLFQRCMLIACFFSGSVISAPSLAELLEHPGTGVPTEGWDGPGQGGATLNWFLGWKDGACSTPNGGVTTDGAVTLNLIEAQVEQAMATWASVVDVRFNKVGDSLAPGNGCFNDPGAYEFDCDGNPDTFQLNIYWASNEHCHENQLWWFDGPWNPAANTGNTFGHSWGPYDVLGGWGDVFGGNVHLDDGENWVTSNPSNIVDEFNTQETVAFVDIQTEALHELGHSLGLDHTNSANAVMNPLKWNLLRRELTQHDRDSILSIYAPAQQSPGVVLLFDLSGSMNWGFDGTGGVPENERRLSLARGAAVPFLELLSIYGEDFAEFAIADFHSDGPNGCNGHTQTNMTLASDAAVQQAINTTIPGLSAAGNTPLLAGLDHARGLFTDQDHRAVVLLSDGYHNCPGAVQAGDQVVTNTINQLNGADISVYPIGFGRPEDFDSALLTRLGIDTGGAYHPVTGADFDPGTWDPATALQNAYKAILVDALDLETAVDPLAVISAGELNEHEVRLTEYDEDVSFMLSWATSGAKRMSLNLFSSDGQQVPVATPEVRYTSGDNYIIITVKNSFLRQADKVGAVPWKMAVRGAGLKEGEQEPYQYSVILRSGVQLRPAIETNRRAAGETLLLTAALVENNRPIARDAEVTVQVVHPEQGLGNWFAAHTVSDAQMAAAEASYPVKQLSPVAIKTIALATQDIQLPGRARTNPQKLHDDGTHGDARGGDGIYSLEFADTAQPGSYEFVFSAKAETRSGQTVTREARTQVELRSMPAAANTEVKSTLIDSSYEITITPKDSLDNYVGPGYAGTFGFTVEQGNTSGELRDNLDGSYTQTVTADDITQSPEVTINLGDTEIRVVVANAGSDGATGRSIPIWFWLLLILLVIVVVILLFRRSP